jgi:Tfp pilus assembly protein PilP
MNRDSNGKGYAVENGTYIGMSRRSVFDIMKDQIVVEEDA